VIRLESVSKSFDGGKTYAVSDVTFELKDDETLVLLGSSGSGKSTALKIIHRLLEPTSGRVEVDGEDLRARDAVAWRRSVGYVFQGIGLFPQMTISQNISVVPRLLGWEPRKRRERARELLELVGLDPNIYSERLPGELSGGQQQRVGVARALAADPHYLLMDEPFGALDALTRGSLQQELVSLKRRLGKTVLFVTHDIFEALTLADRIAVMHEGRLQQIGAPDEVVGSPATEFVRELFERPANQLNQFRHVL
jgi:osmoprotectant transport system ATP-binding protein